MDIENLFGVRDKIVVVTGGSRGIGLMIAKGFVTNGAKVYIASRDQAKCEQNARELSALGPGQCYGMGVDMQDSADIARFASALAERESGGIDILINNAGINYAGNIDSYPHKDFASLAQVNVMAPFFLTQKLLPSLEKRSTAEDPGRVIIVGSIAGLVITKHNSFGYNATKAAVQHMSRGMAVALAPKHITVNSLAPGFFDTLMMAEALDKNYNAVVSSSPLNRLGRPTDMAGACIYLCSKAAAYVTGTILVVDGGTSVKPKI